LIEGRIFCEVAAKAKTFLQSISFLDLTASVRALNCSEATT
jgi:hypothetical protein